MSIEITPEIQAAIDSAVEGLKAKNSDLLAKLKKATKDAAIDPEDFNRLKDENDALQEKYLESQKALKIATGLADTERKAKESEASYVSRLLIDNGLNDSLVAANVKPELLKAAKALFASNAQIVTEGEARKAMIGDKPIAEFVSAWAGSDEGKHFIAAKVNTGGGLHAVGSGAGADLSSLKPVERITAARMAAG